MFRVSLIALVVILCFVTVADVGCMKCGQNVTERLAEKALEQAVEKGSGGKAKIDVGGNVDIADLPVGLRYPAAKAKARWSMTGEHGMGTVYSLETADPAAAVVTFYKTAFATWKQSLVSETDQGTTLVYGNETTKEWTSVSVAKGSDGKTEIVLTYSKGE